MRRLYARGGARSSGGGAVARAAAAAIFPRAGGAQLRRRLRYTQASNQRGATIMGIGGISIWQLLIILVIVLLLFGTKKLKNLGGDLGGAIKGFKKAMNDEKSGGAGDGDGDGDGASAELADSTGAADSTDATRAAAATDANSANDADGKRA